MLFAFTGWHSALRALRSQLAPRRRDDDTLERAAARRAVAAFTHQDRAERDAVHAAWAALARDDLAERTAAAADRAAARDTLSIGEPTSSRQADPQVHTHTVADGASPERAASRSRARGWSM
ncbi:MAG: hypothetical protein ACRD0K_06690 [Egibacteraceae bacterium]